MRRSHAKIITRVKHDVTVDEESASSPGSDSTKRRYNAEDVVAGKYQLIRILGEGGMGEVWEARNIGLDSAVAIKLIRADLNEDSAAERLVQEARAAARLGHPAIVRVFDVGETHFGDPFIVMERLRGDNMGDLLGTEGRLTAVAAVQILLPIADALATAHIKGIVHRDIKPENIYLAEDETGELQPKLVDFGVAKLENAEVDSKLTLRGTIVGSPGYLAPEQARGSEAADYRVDIWAFSVVLYELITGVPPFTGGNYNALLRSIVEDNPTPTVEHRAGDAELWSILERGLRKDAQERWPSMQEYGRALAHWAFSQGVDEDICGTGLEAKWLTGKTSGRASLVSVNFEEFESPSAIRQRRRLRSDSPVLRNASTAATQAPPPLKPPPTMTQLPSPVAAIAEERMFADTEFAATQAAPKRKKALIIAGAAFGVLLLLGIAVALSDFTEPDAASGLAASAVAAPAEAPANAATADAPQQKQETTEPDVSAPVAPPPITRAPSDEATRAPEHSPADLARSKGSSTPTVRKAPRKEAEKPLTKAADTPKLDLKKPY